MASVIFNNALVTIACTTAVTAADISDYVTRVRLTRSFDLHDDTRMGHTAHSRISGIEDWTAELELLQTFGVSAEAQPIDKILASKVGEKFFVAIRPSAAVIRSSDNPEYYGQVILESYTPMDGAVGDLLKTVVPLRSAGNLSRIVTCS